MYKSQVAFGLSTSTVFGQKASTLEMVQNLVDESRPGGGGGFRRFPQRKLPPPPISSNEERRPHHKKDVDNLTDAERTANVEDALERLDLMTRDFVQYILSETVDDVLFACELSPKDPLTSQQAFLLLRCCGSLMVDQPSQDRNQYLQRLLKIFELKGFEMDISHYNVLLSIYMENDYDFKPSDFLAMMEKKSIKPNRVTFQRLLAKFCIEGDTKAAKNFLSALKNDDAALTDFVINALIYGHVVAGEEEAANEILSTMKEQCGFEPTADTYGSMLSAYSRLGDWPKMSSLFQELEKNELYLGDEHMHRILLTLAKFGHDGHFAEVLGMVQPGPGYTSKSIALLAQLMSMDRLDLALKLLDHSTSTMSMSVFCDFMLKDKIISHEMMDTLKTLLGKKEQGLAILTRKALEYHHPEAEQLLEQFCISESTPTDTKSRPQMYYPLLVTAATAKNEGEFLRILKLMVQRDSLRFINHWDTFVFSALELWKPRIESLDYLMSLNVTKPMTLIGAFVMRCLFFGDINILKEGLEKYPDVEIPINSFEIARLLANAFVRRPEEDEQEILLNLVDKAWNNAPGLIIYGDGIGKLVKHLIFFRYPRLEEVLNRFLEKGYRMHSDTSEFLREKLTAEVAPEVAELLAKLGARPDRGTFDSSANLAKMEKEFEETIGKEDQKEKHDHLVAVLHTNYCATGQVVKAETMFTELGSQDKANDPIVLARMITCYGRADLADKAIEYYNKLYEIDPGYHLYENTILRHVARPIVLEKGADAAITFLKSHMEKNIEMPLVDHSVEEIERHERIKRSMIFAGNDVIEAALEKDDVAGAIKLLEFLVDQTDLKPNCRASGTIVKYCIDKGDLEQAKSTFNRLMEKYDNCIGTTHLFTYAVENKDKELLQNTYDAITKRWGGNSAVSELIAVLVTMGKTDDAAKLFVKRRATPFMPKLEWFCRQFSRDKQPEHISNLIKVTKVHIGIADHQQLYRHLVNTYGIQNEWQKALEAWTSMQEDGIPAPDDILVRLANVLERNGQPVPFKRPQLDVLPNLFSFGRSFRRLPHETVVES